MRPLQRPARRLTEQKREGGRVSGRLHSLVDDSQGSKPAAAPIGRKPTTLMFRYTRPRSCPPFGELASAPRPSLMGQRKFCHLGESSQVGLEQLAGGDLRHSTPSGVRAPRLLGSSLRTDERYVRAARRRTAAAASERPHKSAFPPPAGGSGRVAGFAGTGRTAIVADRERDRKPFRRWRP